MYKTLFGPVPSRRLGMSLGVDLVPRKVCSLDCVYCEVGQTTELTVERKEYISFDDVVAELEDFFAHHPDPDYITFSGSGEPTLNSRIGDVLRFIKRIRPHIPVAVLTNGTLLHDPGVRRELLAADVMLPSLDGATEPAFRRINRPAKALDVESYIQGLVDFRKEFSGKIWLEVFILPGFNDGKEDLDALKSAFEMIRPDSIQVNTLDRPGTIPGLRAATTEELERIVTGWDLDHVEIIAAAPERKKVQSYREDAETAILETIARRPCTLEDLEKILGMHVSEINKYLDVLQSEGRIIPVRRERGVFYQPKDR